jgi:hypothetical protein
MGNITSFENSVDTQHMNLDEAYQRINNEANRLINLILERKYTDRDTVCSKLGYQKIDELSNSFEYRTLEGVRHRLGIQSEYNSNLEGHKNQVCLDIVNFYLKKINLITNIQKEIPICKNTESEIYNGLKDKLKTDNLTNEEWYRIYNKLEEFNKEINTRYNLIEQELEKIRKVNTMRELDIVTAEVNSILDRTNSICQKYDNDLKEITKLCLTKSCKKDIVKVPQTPVPFPSKVVVQEVPAGPVVPVVAPKPVVKSQIIKQKYPQIPLEIIPEKSKITTPSKREVRITGEEIQRGPLGISVKNPSKVEYSRIVPKEHARKIKKVLQPGTRKIKLEPVYNIPSNKTSGLPVRAVANHIPKTSSEVSLREGQPTLYLGTSQNGWARVRHSDGTEGYVPHAYLSK